MDNTIEICVTSVESALIAEKAGATRLELCDNLWEGGTTPSAGMIKSVRKKVRIELFVLIRPRGGDFLYSDDEFEIMREEIEFAKQSGVDGIVSGVLTSTGMVDRQRTTELVELASPLQFTFHRAFDCVAEPIVALETIIDCGIPRVLTSGQSQSAFEGAGLLRSLQKGYGDQIVLMPGGGVSSRNIRALAETTGCSEFHLTAKTWRQSEFKNSNPKLTLNGAREIPEDKIMIASRQEIFTVKRILDML